MNLQSKVAVVTGGGSGIGEATRLRLAADGARVAVLALDASSAALTAKLTGDGIAVQVDVSDSAAVDTALAEVEQQLGPVDIWVNNAGIPGDSKRVNERIEQQIAEMSAGSVSTALDALAGLGDEEWRRMLAVHLDGTYYGTRPAARSMAARGT